MYTYSVPLGIHSRMRITHAYTLHAYWGCNELEEAKVQRRACNDKARKQGYTPYMSVA